MPKYPKTIGCSVDGCQKRHVCRGLCGTHYTRFKRTGNPLGLKRPKYGNSHCDVVGCKRQAEWNWLCGMHAMRIARYGRYDYVTPETLWRENCRKAQPLLGKAKKTSYLKLLGRHEHRVVAEKMLGRKLLPGEIVHHKDHDRHNNHPSNLEVMTQSEHIKRHFNESKKLSS